MRPQSQHVLTAASYLLMLLSLLWPAIMFGSPIVAPDTAGYFKSGDLALSLFHKIFLSSNEGLSTSWQGAGATFVPDGAVGIRSSYYGLFVRMLAGLNLWPVVIAQAMIALYTVYRFLSTFAPLERRSIAAVILLLAVVSPLPWFVSYVMPDLLSGVLILLVCVVLFQEALPSPVMVAFDCVVIVFCLVAHTSNLLLASAMAILVLCTIVRFKSSLAGFRIRAAIFCGLIGVAFAAQVFSNFVAFGVTEITARAPPFLLARSLVDGPGRLYLQTACKNPSVDYFMCRYVDNLPLNEIEFLWSPRGIYMSATPEERTKIRSEQMDIVGRAAVHYPLLQLQASLQNFWQTLISVDVRDERTDLEWRSDQPGPRIVETTAPTTILRAQEISSWLSQASALISLTLIGCLIYVRGFTAVFPIVPFVLVALIGNAAITGILSSVSARYQARVIWLVPLVACVMLTILWRNNTKRVASDVKSARHHGPRGQQAGIERAAS